MMMPRPQPIRSFVLLICGMLVGGVLIGNVVPHAVRAEEPQASDLHIASGVTLAEFCQSTSQFQQAACFGYVAGISDAMIDRRITGGNPAIKACIPRNETVGIRTAKVVKWLRRHERRLLEPAAGLTAAALTDAYPCTK